MEEQNQTQATEHAKLIITNREKHHLNVTRKWAYFLSIIGFIFVGLFVLVAIFMGFLLPNLGQTTVLGSIPALAFSALYLVLGLIYFFPVFYLYRFSIELKVAIYEDIQEKLSSGLRNISLVFKFIGITTIVLLALYPAIILLSMSILKP